MFEQYHLKLRSKQSGSNVAVAVGLIVILATLSILMSDMYVPALPEISGYFHVNHSMIRLTIGVYLLGMAVLPLLSGPISDKIGRRKVILVGLMVCLLGSVLAVTAVTVSWLMLGRFIQGLGIGAVAACSRTLLRDIFEPEMQARVAVYLALAIGIAPAVAPLIGGYLEYLCGWRAIFVGLTIIVLLLFVIMLVILPETNHFFNKNALQPKVLLRNYRKIMGARSFYVNMIVNHFMFASILVYYTLTPYIYQVELGVSTVKYSWLSVIFIVVMFIPRTITLKFLQKTPLTSRVGAGAGLFFIGAFMLLLLQCLGVHNLYAILLPACLMNMGAGLAFGNTLVLALRNFTKTVGAAAALWGFMQAAIAGLLVVLAAHLPGSQALDLALVQLSIAVVVLVISLQQSQRGASGALAAPVPASKTTPC